jgi:hypothetical protein
MQQLWGKQMSIAKWQLSPEIIAKMAHQRDQEIRLAIAHTVHRRFRYASQVYLERLPRERLAAVLISEMAPPPELRETAEEVINAILDWRDLQARYRRAS